MSKYEMAEAIAALWTLGGEPGDAIPTSMGILDRALEGCCRMLPPPLCGLEFSVTSVGLRCLSLPDLILAGEDMMVLSACDGFTAHRVRIGEESARLWAVSAGLSTEQARSFGRTLRAAVAVEQERANSGAGRIL